MPKRRIAGIALVDAETGVELEQISPRTEESAVDMEQGGTLKEKLSEIDNRIAAGEGGIPRFIRDFVPGDFTRRITRYILTVPASEHKLGVRVGVRDCLRLENGAYGNVLVQYNVLTNGDVTVTSDNTFAGELILEGY